MSSASSSPEKETRFNGSPELVEGGEDGEGESKPLIVDNQTPGEEDGGSTHVACGGVCVLVFF